MRNFLDHKHHLHFPRQIHSPAVSKICARLLQKPVAPYLCRTHPVGKSPNEYLIGTNKQIAYIDNPAVVSDNSTTVLIAALVEDIITATIPPSNSK